MRIAHQTMGRRWARSAILGLALGWGLSSLGHAQAVATPYSYTRTSSFTYQSNGQLSSETVEPGLPQQCVQTSYTYDAYGNKASAATQNCAGASGPALFDTRRSSTSHGAHTVTLGSLSVNVPAGAFPTEAKVALTANLADAASHVESRQFDPRFGAPLTLVGPNGLQTSWQYDDFGRKVLELRADGTQTAVLYCVLPRTHHGNAADTTSSTAGCPAAVPAEAPDDSVRFEHSEPRNASGVKMGAYSRVYFDRAGRKLRSVTEAFDGSTQPGGINRLVVQDTDYNAQGVAVLTTQPYFLDTGASTTGGANSYGMTHTVVDVLGRPTVTYISDPTGQAGSWTFGARGSRTAARSQFNYAGLASTLTDDLGRTRTEEKNPEGKVVRVTDAYGAQVVHDHDAFGNLLVTKDALQNRVLATFDVRGRRLTLSDPDAGVTAACYDALGQVKAQQSSNQRGSHTPGACPSFNGQGTTAPAVAGWTTMAHDRLGRLTSRAEPEFTSTWVFDNCTKGKGKLCQVTTSHGLTRTWAYDSLGRLANTRQDIANETSTMATALAYDASTGRLAAQTYPTGIMVGYVYTAKGYLLRQELKTAVKVQPLPATPGGTPAASKTLQVGAVLWRADAVNAWGKAETESLANSGIYNRASFEANTGRVEALTAGAGTTAGVMGHAYTWNSANQLLTRVDALGDGSGFEVEDTYTYDLLGRLTGYEVQGNGSPNERSVTLQYNALGMLLYKSDVGVYTYGSQATAGVRPHALQQVSGYLNAHYTHDLNGNLTWASGGKYRSVSYTSFNLPDAQSGLAGPSGSPRYAWHYDEDHKRLKETHAGPAGTRTTWFLHPDNRGGLSFEREVAADGTPSNRHYLSAGSGVFAVLVTRGALPALGAGVMSPPAPTGTVTAVKLEYWHKDHLGSLLATTDHLGNVTARYAYDPFGKRRYTNGSYDAFGTLVIDWTSQTNAGTDRGFTGHEHLDDVGLVHMNGRLFDPTLARFMQADPFIQDPTNLQNFDRYAYCYNNPLTCTDPSGEFFFLAALAFEAGWGAIAAGVAADLVLAKSMPELRPFIGLAWSIALAPGVELVSLGAGQTAIAGFAGGAISSGSLKGGLQGAFSALAFNAVGDFIGKAGFVDALGKGGDFAAQVALHGVTGCVTSVAGGGKCSSGALSAAFSKALNFVPGLDGKPGQMTSEELLANVAVRAVSGGVASVLGGGKFANGATTGAFSYLFNFLGRCRSNAECMKREGYLGTQYSDGTLCNGPRDPACRFPGAAGENAGANVSGGSEVTVMVGFAGASLSATKAIDTNQNVCTVVQGCILVGAGLYFGAEGVAQASTGRLSTGSVGGIGLFGKGGMGPSANVTPIQVNFDGSVAGQVGSGVGYGGGAGLKICQQSTTCPK